MPAPGPRAGEDAIEIRRWTGDRALVRVETSAPWVFAAETLDAEPNSPRYPRPARIAIRFAEPAASGYVRVTFTRSRVESHSGNSSGLGESHHPSEKAFPFAVFVY